jgi:uncharacterized protein DUF2017
VGNHAARLVRSLQPRIKRTRRGDFQLRLPSAERELLRSLPGELRELMGTDDPALRRLSPPAYSDDPEREAEYRGMVADDLASSRRHALEVMEATVDATRLDEDQLVAWLGALNDLRLVLGTKIDVTEDTYEREPDPSDPDAAAFAVFAYLGWLEEQAVAALASQIDPRGTNA